MSWQHEHIKASSFSTMIKPSYYILIFASTTVLQTTEYWPSQLYFSVPLFKLIGLMQELLYPLKKKKKNLWENIKRETIGNALGVYSPYIKH